MHRILATAVATSFALVSSAASATPMAGMAVAVQPATSTSNVEQGGYSMWGAWEVGKGGGYLGFEVEAGNFDVPDDFGLSFHMVGGVKTRLSERFFVLADVGAGATQQTEFRIRIFESEKDDGGFKGVQALPSAATRVQLVGELGVVGATTVGVALSSEARVGLFPADGDLATAGLGVGLGLFLQR